MMAKNHPVTAIPLVLDQVDLDALQCLRNKIDTIPDICAELSLSIARVLELFGHVKQIGCLHYKATAYTPPRCRSTGNRRLTDSKVWLIPKSSNEVKHV